jgi:hypothetical protein
MRSAAAAALALGVALALAGTTASGQQGTRGPDAAGHAAATVALADNVVAAIKRDGREVGTYPGLPDAKLQEVARDVFDHQFADSHAMSKAPQRERRG